MPVYLCQPGHSSSEPWRHGVQVHARPFPLPGDAGPSGGERGGEGRRVPSPAVPDDVDQTVVTLGSDDERFPTLLRYIDERAGPGAPAGGGDAGHAGTGMTAGGPPGRGVLVHAPRGVASDLVRRLAGAGRSAGLYAPSDGGMTGHEAAEEAGRYGRGEDDVLVVSDGGDEGDGALLCF